MYGRGNGDTPQLALDHAEPDKEEMAVDAAIQYGELGGVARRGAELVKNAGMVTKSDTAGVVRTGCWNRGPTSASP